MVINFELPKIAEDYVHRIGRTGRADESGEAISLVSADEFEYLRKIEQLLREIIPREHIDNFATDHTLPESKGVPAPSRPKKDQRNQRNQNHYNYGDIPFAA